MELTTSMNTHILAIIPTPPTSDPRGKGDPHGDPRKSTLRKRINRVLAKCGKKLIVTRFAEDKAAYGTAYVIETDSFAIVERNVDLEAYAKMIGCADPEAYIPTV